MGLTSFLIRDSFIYFFLHLLVSSSKTNSNLFVPREPWAWKMQPSVSGKELSVNGCFLIKPFLDFNLPPKLSKETK